MMSLFSSFNPMTNINSSINWIMILLPLLIMTNSYWATKSKIKYSYMMMMMKMIKQFQPSMPKMYSANIIIIILIMISIMAYNIFSLLPYTFSITSHLMVNLSLSLTLWMALIHKKLTKPLKFLAQLTPTNTPSPLIPFMVVIELVSLMIQPITLSIRLTANVTAGHIMINLISQMYEIYLAPTLMANLMMTMMELGVAMIQAYVFAMLLIMYSK